MSDLPLPGDQVFAWQTHGHTPYLPPNLIASYWAGGRRIRQIYNQFGVAIHPHSVHGFAIQIGHFMAETKLDRNHVFVDLWEVISITETNPGTKTTPGSAQVTFQFCSRKHDLTYEHATHVTMLTKKYASMCEDAAELARIKSKQATK